MRRMAHTLRMLTVLAAAALLALAAPSAEAGIDGITGTSFQFTAKADTIATGEGNSLLIWGFANGTGRAQYPGPTLILTQGDTVTVTLTNSLPVNVPVSIVFPGHVATATAVSGPVVGGPLTLEAQPGGVVQYTFTASQPGTYTYQSGSQSELAVEMGLVGAIIVRPANFNPAAPTAYGTADSAYDREYLFVLSEMDPRIHDLVAFLGPDSLVGTDYLANYFPNYWFINGRTAPDTLAAAGTGLLPTQPYNSLPRMRPGERVLMRVVGAGRELHPFHHHGNHARVIAKDGRLLSSGPGRGADLSHEVFTVQTVPGKTVDAIFGWTGKDLGWDIYGTGPDYAHDCVDGDNDGYDDATKEWCADHGKPLPVILPGALEVTFGGFYSGSPYLGTMGALPPGEGGLNPNAGFVYMWHSHTEKELTNFDVFPGGLMTMLIVEPPGTPID